MAYCVRADVEAIFGKGNVEEWGDLDGDRVIDDITARITTSITQAQSEIDTRMFNGIYTLPLENVGAATTPEIVKLMCARLTGVLLFEARGTSEVGKDAKGVHRLTPHRVIVDDFFRGLKVGTQVLDAKLAVKTLAPTTLEPSK